MQSLYLNAERVINGLVLLLLNKVTRPIAFLWWAGPILVLFAWVLVPIMRRRHNVLLRDDYSQAARFWWAPIWPGLGLLGLGWCLAVSPLLDSRLSSRWAPSAWLGIRANMSLAKMALFVVSGLVVGAESLRVMAHAWLGSRETRLRAWRWRQGSRS